LSAYLKSSAKFSAALKIKSETKRLAGKIVEDPKEMMNMANF